MKVKGVGLKKIETLLLIFCKIPFIRRFATPTLKRDVIFLWTVIWGKFFVLQVLSPLLYIGKNVSLNDKLIVAWEPVYIGDNTSFSYCNTIITSTHDFVNFNNVIGKPVKIGSNCWITSNFTILPGVEIGDNTIIGAGSVVTKDIPSGVLAAGNPCKVIKSIRFKC